MTSTELSVLEYLKNGGKIKSLPTRKAVGSKTFGSKGAAWHRGHQATALKDSGHAKAIGGK